MRVFIAADGRRRIEGAEAGNPLAAKHPTDGGGRDPEGGGNLRAGPAETAQRNGWMVTAGGNAPRIRCGRELRSRKPSAPSVW